MDADGDGLLLPRDIGHVGVPPMKIQGIKTKLIPFIARSIRWDGDGVWYEPFMGSGCVGFNIAPERAVFSDVNPWTIRFYDDLMHDRFTADDVRDHLTREGALLAATPADRRSHYYEVRDRFNESHSPLDLLFLQRSNFNGMMRFGPHGYNVPFGRKPNRFAPALITKIVHQTEWVRGLMRDRDWRFVVADWRRALSAMTPADFAYLDPPYFGRHAEYFAGWSRDDADALADYANHDIPGGWALSMWYGNARRRNDHLALWDGVMTTTDHFYFIGGHEANRAAMTEALVIRDGWAAPGVIDVPKPTTTEPGSASTATVHPPTRA